MKSSIKISIPKPCNQKWSGMNQNGSGRFCDSCEQTVVDFTYFSNLDLKNWFAKNQGKSCGRFNPEQLNRLIINETNFSINRFKPNLIVASLIAFLSFPKLSSAQFTKPTTIQTADLKKKSHNNEVVLSDSVRTIKGRVIDKDDKI